uniref:Iron-sulfur cluster carrier protein n=1 Tax=Babesia bovis TaxID=5865 RepID=A7AX43_BABBO|eukprot:XP_001608684.1 hypothetical protein [Babesia bovis T2Bo]
MHWNVSHIVAVHSCKGGVGKSTVAAGLALSLKNNGHSVGICDLDIYGPNIASILGLSNSYVLWKRVHFAESGIEYDTHGGQDANAFSIGSAATSGGKASCCSDVCDDIGFTPDETATTCLMEPKEAHGIKVMSFSFIKSERELGYAAYRGPIIDQIASELVLKTDWGRLDYLILDLPPGTGDVIITLMEDVNISSLVAVTTPHELSINDLFKGINLFQDYGVPIVCLVENMSYFVCDGCDKLHHLFGSIDIDLTLKSLGISDHVCLPIIPSGVDFVQSFYSNTDVRTKFLEIATLVTNCMNTNRSQFSSIKR